MDVSARSRMYKKKKTRRLKDIYTRLNRGQIDDWRGGEVSDRDPYDFMILQNIFVTISLKNY